MKNSTVVILLVCAIAAASLFPVVASAQSYPYPAEYVIKYYSDATYTNEIGGRWTDCCGDTVFWGYSSNYKIETQLECGPCFFRSWPEEGFPATQGSVKEPRKLSRDMWETRWAARMKEQPVAERNCPRIAPTRESTHE